MINHRVWVVYDTQNLILHIMMTVARCLRMGASQWVARASGKNSQKSVLQSAYTEHLVACWLFFLFRGPAHKCLPIRSKNEVSHVPCVDDPRLVWIVKESCLLWQWGHDLYLVSSGAVSLHLSLTARWNFKLRHFANVNESWPRGYLVGWVAL